MKKIDLLELSAVIANAWPKLPPNRVARLSDRLCRYGARIKRLATDYCNGDVQNDDYDHAIERVESGIKEQSRDFPGFKYKIGGDPRGYTLKIILPTEQYNTLGGKEEGWGVPTS